MKYSEKQNVGIDEVYLSYNGKAVLDTDTPLSIGFKDGDILFASEK